MRELARARSSQDLPGDVNETGSLIGDGSEGANRHVDRVLVVAGRALVRNHRGDSLLVGRVLWSLPWN